METEQPKTEKTTTMRMMIRRDFYDRTLVPTEMPARDWMDMLRNPPVRPDKERSPLGLYGIPVSGPSIDPATGRPAYRGANVAFLTCLQLDYDSGTSISDWMASHGDLAWACYTSHSHGYKGTGDRFRAVLPLAEPLDCGRMDHWFKEAMAREWGCDPTCFDRGHCQLLPCVRGPDAPYRWGINRGRRYSIDWTAVEAARERAHAELDFREAASRFNREWSPETPDGMAERAVAWAERELSAMREGSRNATSFRVLSFLHRAGVGPDSAERLAGCVDADFESEFLRMAARLL